MSRFKNIGHVMSFVFNLQVKWSKENYHHDLASPYNLRLASADHNGVIIIWDVAQAAIRAEFSDSSKPVAGLLTLQSLKDCF